MHNNSLYLFTIIPFIPFINNNSLYLHNSYTYILYSKDLNILLARLFVVNRLF